MPTQEFYRVSPTSIVSSFSGTEFGSTIYARGEYGKLTNQSWEVGDSLKIDFQHKTIVKELEPDFKYNSRTGEKNPKVKAINSFVETTLTDGKNKIVLQEKELKELRRILDSTKFIFEQ